MADLKVYKDSELSQLAPVIGEARRLWESKIKEYLVTSGDRGPCVLGAGIVVKYLPPRARNYRSKMIIDAPSFNQGSWAWEASQADIITFLRERRVDAYYEYGRMD